MCVSNQKGGVGKTTTAIALAVALARRGRRVLAVDCDPQATLTRQLGVDHRWLALSLVDVLTGRAGAGEATVSTGVGGLDVLPAVRELSRVEMSLVGEVGRERFLVEALAEVSGAYELVVIDTPPNLGLLTVNALVCAGLVLAPVSAEDEASVQGLAELRGTVARLDRLRPETPPVLALITRWAPGRILAAAIEDAVHDLGVPILGRVPSRAVVGHAAARRSPLGVLAPDNAVSLAYERVADQLAGVTV